MISTRILDNDMGSVAKVPLTGRGTVHGITIEIDSIRLPEFGVGLLEMVAADMSVPKFAEHCEEHLGNAEQETKFVEAYKTFVTPLNRSRR